MADWFEQNAPKAQQPQQQDWFEQNAPKDPATAQAKPSTTHYDSLAPRPSTWWEKAEEAVIAPIRESSFGRAFHKDTITEAAKQKDPRLAEDSFLRLTESHPENLLPKDAKILRGVVKGGAQFGTDMLSPTNLALMAGTMGLGGPEAPVAGRVLGKLIGGKFTFDMVKSAASMSPKLLDQIKIGDSEGAAETLTSMVASLGMAGATMAHLTSETKAPGIEPPPVKEKSGTSPAKSPELKGEHQMSREDLEKWHANFEREHPEMAKETETKPPNPETKTTSEETKAAAADAKPINPEAPGALETFLKDEEGAFKGFDQATEEMRATYNLRKQLLKSVEDAKGSPLEKSWGQRAIEWYSGERNTWGARYNQEASRIRKNLVPEKVEREALTLMRDFKNRPGEMQQFLDGTHPEYMQLGRNTAGPMSPKGIQEKIDRVQKARAIVEKALNPTKGMIEADRRLDRVAEISLLTGKKLGLLNSKLTPEEYTPHMLHPVEAENDPVSLTERFQGTALGGKISRRLGGFAKAREAYPTMLHAIADGAIPKTMDALDAFTIYSDRFATARATKLLQMKLKDAKVGRWSLGGDDVPKGWVPFAAHSNEFRNIVTVVGSDGLPHSAEQRLYVPKFVDEAMRPITDPDYTSRLPKFANARVLQQGIKAANLSLSFFHAKALTTMATANMNPWEAGKALRSNLESPEMEAQERDMILHTGTSDIQGRTYEAYHNLKSNSIPTWDDILTKAPGLKQMNMAAEKITEFTFGNLQRKYKIWDFAKQKAEWIGEHPNATAAELTAAKISIAKQVNAVYGGLNWETLGWSRQALQMSRLIMLAPDWTISNFYNLKQSFEGGPKAAAKDIPLLGRALPKDWEGNAGGKAARAFWIKSMVGGIVATQLLSRSISGQWSPNPTMVYMGKDKKGNDILQNIFFSGAPGDLVNILGKTQKYGLAVGAAEWLVGKMAPGVRGMAQLGMNQTYMHQPIIPSGMDPRSSTLRGTEYIARDVAPIPFSVQNMFDQSAGKDADQYDMKEYLTTLIAGTPPQHRPPAGYHQTKKGLEPIHHSKPDKDWWDQAITGKVR